MIPFSLEELREYISSFGFNIISFSDSDLYISLILTAILVWIIAWFTCKLIYVIICRFESR